MEKYTTEEFRLAQKVNVYEYLRAAGYEMQKSGGEYQLKIHDSLKINPDGRWYWYSRNMGRHSPVELIKELEGEGIVRTVKKLADYAKGNGAAAPDISEATQSRKEIKVNQTFQLPEKNTETKRVYAYLNQTRGIDSEIIAYCIKSGLIYESSNYHNAVFVGQKDDQGAVRHASLRGTYASAKKPFKGDVTGADKSYSFALTGKNDRLIVCESAIDALSHASTTKMEGGDWTADHRLALGGMSDASLERYLKRHPEIKRLEFCLDNDREGRDSDGNSHNHGQERAAVLVEQYKSSYEVKNAVTEAKDLNEELTKKNAMERERGGDKRISAAGKKETGDVLLKRIEEGVKGVYTSSQYINYLKNMSKFHNYSVSNIMLVMQQMPQATRVAGYQKWKKDFGRTVKKGEAGILIQVPITRMKTVKVEEYDPRSGRMKEIEKQKKEIIGFRDAYVFDVSQTEGQKLPQITAELQGSVKRFDILMAALKQVSKVPIFIDEIMGESKGYFSAAEHKIVIQKGMSEVQTIKTAIHELAHSRMHVDTKNREGHSRSTKEIQAESAAFIVAEHFGLDTSEYSFPYIASWAANRNFEELKEPLDAVQKEVHEIIPELEQSIEKILVQEKEAEALRYAGEHSAVKPDTALSAFRAGIPVYLHDKQAKKLTPIKDENEIKAASNALRIFAKDVDEKKEASPDVYQRYVMKLFAIGWKKNPMETIKVFGGEVKQTSLNQVILDQDPLIKKALSNAASADACMKVIQKSLRSGNEVKGKVKVQIIHFDGSGLQDGQFFSLGAANKIFENLNQRMYDEREHPERIQTGDQIKFGLYIQDADQCRYGASTYEPGSGFAESLMEYIEKTMEPAVVETCGKELKRQERVNASTAKTAIKKSEIERGEK